MLHSDVISSLVNLRGQNQFSEVSKRWWIGIAAIAGLVTFYVDRGFDQLVGQFFSTNRFLDSIVVRMVLRNLWLPLFLAIGQYFILRTKINRSYLWIVLTPVVWFGIEHFSPLRNLVTSSMFGLAFTRESEFFSILQHLVLLSTSAFFHGFSLGLSIGLVQSLICKLKRSEMIQWSLWSALGLGVAFLLTNLTQGIFLMDSVRSIIAHERLLAYFSIVIAFLFSEGFLSFVFYGLFTASRLSMLASSSSAPAIEIARES